MKLGKTGDYPEGKLNETDEGGLRIAIGTEKGDVVIRFGTPVSWIAFSPDEATKLAIAILSKASSCP